MSWRMDDLPEGARQALKSYFQRPAVQADKALFDEVARPLELADRAVALVEKHQWELMAGVALTTAALLYLVVR